MKVGFVGLGSMGLPIARNLLKAGNEVSAYNRTRSRAEALKPEGARVAETVADASAPGVVLTMLADDHALAECVFNKGGILDSLPANGLHISLSTISVKLSQHLAAKHREHGQRYISAPVFGRPPAAEAAQLLVVAAGPAEDVEQARPLLEPIGRKLVVLGAEPSMANALKLSGNFVIASMLEALGEGYALARKHGIEATQMLEILSMLFQSPVYDNYGRMIAEERFEPAGFKMVLGLKDARLVLAAADAAGVPMPLASLIHDQLISGVARGHGEIDWSGIARVVAENAGL